MSPIFVFLLMMLNWLSIVTGFFYGVLGVFVIYRHWFLMELEPLIAYLLGGLMIIYGIFRMVRAIYRLRQRDEE